jgi:cellobiose-specific phosphotransferase system component IIC
MTGSRPITTVTFGSLAIAGLIGVVWFFSVHGTSRFEPAISSLGLLAG